MIGISKPIKWLGIVMGLSVAGILAISLACGADDTATPAPTRAPAGTVAPVPTTAPVATTAPVGQPQYGGTLRVAGSLTLKTFDPHFSVQSGEYRVMFAIYNNLVKHAPGLQIEPDLAESWDVSPDGKAITFHLVKGAKFHDGSDLTAQAIKWNMEDILDPEGGSTQRRLLEGIIDRLEVVDTNTITFHLVNPHRPLLATLTDRPGIIISPTAVAKYGGGLDGDYGKNPQGTGPFRLTSWIPDGDVKIERVDNYWEEGKPYLDGIHYLNISDSSARLAMLRTGEADIQQMRAVDLPLVENDPSLKVSKHESGAYYGLQIGLHEEPWTNLALRQAIAYGIDREAVCNTYFDGNCRLAYTPEGIGWVYNPDIKPYPFNTEVAKAKLVEAGYPDGVTLPIWFTSSNIDFGELVQAMLLPIGIKLEIQQITGSDWFTLRAKKQSHFMYASWFPRADPHNRLQILHHSTGWANTTGYNDPVTDRLIDQAAQEYDLVKAKLLYNEVQTRLTESAHIQYLNYTNVYMLMNKDVQGWVWIGDLFHRFRDLWLEQ